MKNTFKKFLKKTIIFHLLNCTTSKYHGFFAKNYMVNCTTLCLILSIFLVKIPYQFSLFQPLNHRQILTGDALKICQFLSKCRGK